jgi:hypothetical protein
MNGKLKRIERRTGEERGTVSGGEQVGEGEEMPFYLVYSETHWKPRKIMTLNNSVSV